MAQPVQVAKTFSDFVGRTWYYPLIRGVISVGFGIAALAWPTKTLLVLVIALGVLWFVDGVLSLISVLRSPDASARSFTIGYALLSVVTGLVLVIWPLASGTALVLVAGIWAILGGVLLTASAFAARSVPGWGWGLAAGLSLLVLGVLVVVNPGVTAIIFAIWIGVWSIVFGIWLVALAFQLRALGRRAAAL